MRNDNLKSQDGFMEKYGAGSEFSRSDMRAAWNAGWSRGWDCFREHLEERGVKIAESD